ncbi:hypothetical protein GCM10009775_26410 [Microbacterium aoyamense]|uniref:Prepilin-type N-terminal cleavage/methylation domain-containing protein n=1 Tax=Microbacterium aoyamense TaxID=344166 RepID=A0ABN2PVI7_9MICO|nr:hypothetical protein [Microbacterium aoyamense]
MIHRTGLHDDDAGISLVEVIIYAALSAVIATLAAFMFINTLKGQETVTAVTTATTRGQTAVQAIERAVRNAKDVSVSSDGSTITVLTTLATPCQSWRVSGGALQIAQGGGAPSWKTFAEDVELPEGSSVYFSESGDSAVSYHLAFPTDSQPVTFVGSILPRSTGGSVSASCS